MYTNAFSQFDENIEEMNPVDMATKLVPSWASPIAGVPTPSVQEGATSVEMECQCRETRQPCTELTSPWDSVGGIMRIVPSDANVSNCLKIFIMY